MVLGLGSSGTGAEACKFYLKLGHDVAVLRGQNDSQNEIASLSAAGITFVSRNEAINMASGVDLVVKLPGIPVPFEIKQKASKITNDIVSLLEHPATEQTKRIVIVGNKGKTMTASALSHALTQLGTRNIFSEGVGFSAFHILSAIENGVQFKVIILEMSKWNIRDTYEILGHKWPRIDYLAVTDNLPVPVLDKEYNAEGALIAGPWTQKVVLPRFQMKKLLFSGTAKKNKLKGIPSFNNPYRNSPGLELAWELLRAMGYEKNKLKGIFDNYKGIPNRMELVLSHNGISFINDSASVLPLSVPFAMRTLNNSFVHLLLGGDDKSHQDLSDLLEAASEAVSVTLLTGSLTDKIIPLLRQEGIAFSGPFSNMKEAVMTAYQNAIEHRGGREQLSEFILLSPGAYSDGNYENEFERGQVFRGVVRQIFRA